MVRLWPSRRWMDLRRLRIESLDGSAESLRGYRGVLASVAKADNLMDVFDKDLDAVALLA